MSSNSQITIVGAGVIGLNLAYQLSLNNYQVTLVEKEVVEQTNSIDSASWASLGVISAKGRQASQHLYSRVQLVLLKWLNNQGHLLTSDDLKLAQFWQSHLHPQLLELMKQHWNRSGMVQVTRSVEKGSKYQKLCQYEQTKGSSMQLWTPEILSEYYRQGPRFFSDLLNSEQETGLFYPEDGYLEVPTYLRSLISTLKKLSVCFKEKQTITQVQKKNHGLEIQTSTGETINTDWLILAAGSRCSEILDLWNFKALPQTTSSGTTLRPENQISQAHTILSHDHFTCIFNKSGQTAVSLKKNKDQNPNNLLLQKIPLNSSGQIQTGIRSRSLDRYPLISPHPECARLIVCTQFYKSGYSFAPFAAAQVKSLIEDGKIFSPNLLWRPDREYFLSHLAQHGGHGWGKSIYQADQMVHVADWMKFEF